MTKEKNKKKPMIGEIIGISGINTVKIRVESTRTSKLYAKRYKVHKNFLVDTDKVKVETGDLVEFVETTPISKRKKHKISKKIN